MHVHLCAIRYVRSSSKCHANWDPYGDRFGIMLETCILYDAVKHFALRLRIYIAKIFYFDIMFDIFLLLRLSVVKNISHL